MEGVEHQWGRLKYLEPTNLYNEMKSGWGEDIPFPYEDYCMSVDLTVHIANRYSCGWAKKNGMEKVLKYSSEEQTISFLKGSKISDNLSGTYLTTNFTDISMTNPGENTSECLGIESISITYNTWTHPEVTIKFVDVRGATVMQPSEAAYYNKEEAGISKELYKALFTFPYPMFELKVKGFYGKGVTYKLAVSKTDIEMDAQTGNFIITVSLIGFMYGIYTDLPMTFISVAPYIPGGREYWENKINDGTFMFKDAAGQPSQPMVKIPELRIKLAQASTNEDATSAAAIGKQTLNRIDEQISALMGILDLYPLKDFESVSDEKYLYCVCKNWADATAIGGKIEAFCKELETYNEAYKVNYLNDFKSFNEIRKNPKTEGYSIEYYVKEDEDEDGNVEKVLESRNREKSFVIVSPKVEEFIKSKCTNVGTIYLCYINRNGLIDLDVFNKKINDQVDNLRKQKENEELNYKTKELEIIEKVLGFRPSIRNIYELIFAHMETFMYCFYEQTNEIATQILNNHKFRLKPTYGVKPGDTDTEDVTSNIDGVRSLNKFLPPYTGFFKESVTGVVGKNNSRTTAIKEMVWPENYHVYASNLEEVKFVKSLINGGELYYDKNKQADDALAKMKSGATTTGMNAPTSFIGGFIPLTTYDFINKDKTGNPYTFVKEKIANNENIEGDILGTFALRAFYYNAINEDSKSLGAFGVLEALNFYKAIGNSVSQKFLEFIKVYAGDMGAETGGTRFLQTITRTDQNKASDTWKFVDNSKLFYNNGIDLRYALHDSVKNENQESMLPVGVFDFVKIKNLYNSNENLFDITSLLSTKVPNENTDSGSSSFVIFEDRDYLDKLANEVEIEVNNATEYMKAHKGDSGMTTYKYDEYGRLFKQNRILNRYSEIGDDSNIGGYLHNTIIGLNEDITFSNKILLETDLVNSTDFFIKKPITEMRRNNNLSRENIYNYSKYNAIDNNLVKAYIFLRYLPLANTNFVNINGNELYSSLLVEGGYYWFEDFKKTNDYENYKDICEELIFNFNKNLTSENCTPSRRNVLKNMFEKWVETKFSGIDEILSNKDYYENNNFITLDSKYSNGYILQSYLRELLFKVVTTLDLYNGVDNEIKSKSTSMVSAFKDFIRELKKLYERTIDEMDEKGNQDAYIRDRISAEQVSNPFKSDDLYLSTYIALKSLYDKWLCAPPESPDRLWTLSNDEKSDFNNFIYTDSFYHDIGYVLPINITKTAEWLDSCLPTSSTEGKEGLMGYHGKSVYNFLSEVAQDCGGMLLAIPQKFGSYDKKSVIDAFRAYPLYENWDTDESSFVFMYTYKPSEHLGDMDTRNEDMNGYNREGDGLNLTDDEYMGLVTSDDGYTIPAFGVTYAKQNQSMFKNIRLNTVDAGVTEAGLAATFNIASKASEGPRETMLYGQDLYRIYSQYSYKCSVEMMGNVQIMPLMYFQLNNVPLWKGGYQILKVNHEISAGDFRTTFEGVRINRNSIPMAGSVAITIKDTGDHDTGDGLNIKEKLESNKPNNSNNMTDIKGNHNVIIETVDFDENNVSETKPIICITPAHGPQTQKRLEWEWSSKVVDKMKELLSMKTYKDGTSYNVQRCNKNGQNSSASGYSMRETKNFINKFGSKKVISVVPHWNGGGGQRYEIYTNHPGKTRSDSQKLAECMQDKVREFVFYNEPEENIENLLKDKFGECGNNGCACAFKRTSDRKPVVDIKELSINNTDGAPRLDCACILTENWYPDYDCKYNKPASGDWTSGNITEGMFYHWLNNFNNSNGINLIHEIAQMHVDAIESYIESL